MDLKTLNASITEIPCDVLIVNLFKGVTVPGGATGAVDRSLDGLLSRLIEEEHFEGSLGQTLLVHTHGKIPAGRVIIAGLGEKEKFDLNGVRKASAAACRKAREVRAKKVVTITHGTGIGGLSVERAAQATAEGALIGTYQYLQYKSEPNGHQIEEMVFVEVEEKKMPALEWGVQRGEVVGQAVNRARDLINAPANEVTPTYLAKFATELAGEAGLEVEILERSEAERLKMGAYLAVTSGSEEPPKFIVMKYKPADKSDHTIAIIGKGVTFDSGGLSLKNAESMATMKDDMSGAAAVLATMRAVARLKPTFNVMAIVAATENMPSGTAVRPGDVVRAMNGKTIEVENTDAEGRLTLADALSYAVTNGADELIDLATLTGACVVALGRVVSGVMSNNQDLVNRLMTCSEISGDMLWQLPLYEEYKPLIDSPVADMKNTGGREAGAITAALLLKEFTSDKPWAHIDIAGPAYITNGNGLVEKGGTGAGVRLLIEYLCGGPETRGRD